MSNDLPSFDKAQYALAAKPGVSAPDQCKLCSQPIAENYYRVNGDMACGTCAAQATPNLPADSHAAFTRAILYGIGAAILGMVLYAGFEMVTGIIIGYLAIGVGYLVGKAMKLGSKGRGGRRYQVAAALLTYASVSIAAIPAAIYTYSSHRTSQVAAPADSAAAAHPFPEDSSGTSDPPEQHEPMSRGAALIALTGLGLASPFLELREGFGGIIGLFILFLGIRAAWSLTAGHDFATPDISGPYAAKPHVV